MKSIKLINHSSHSRGQVSLEALILWAGFAAILAILLPAFTNLIHAQSTRVEVENTRSFSHSLSQMITHFSFLSPGSRQTISIPLAKNLSIETESNFILVSYFSEGMKSPYEKKIPSALLLEYENAEEESNDLILIRTSEGITLQYAETFLP